MNRDGLFLTSGDGLVVLTQRQYQSEAVLQRALAEYPEVIAGPSTTGTDRKALLLVRRELGVPAQHGGGAVWSLDHLFLDAEGVPVVVEVKRSSDTRIRREVVGQMMDYAANGVKYWPIATLRAAVEETAAGCGKTGDERVRELGVDDPEEFWKAVEANLGAGRIRMLFVADELPPELVRIIEFLNEQMTPAEVLGVELRQYTGGDHTVYVPHVVGRTSGAVDRKTTASGQEWCEESYLEAARARRDEAEVAVIERLLAHVQSRQGSLRWGKGITPGVSGWYDVAGKQSAVWNLNINNPSARTYLYFYLADLVTRAPSSVAAAARELESIPSMASKIADARAAGWNKYPSLYLADVVATPNSVEAVFRAIDALTATSQR